MEIIRTHAKHKLHCLFGCVTGKLTNSTWHTTLYHLPSTFIYQCNGDIVSSNLKSFLIKYLQNWICLEHVSCLHAHVRLYVHVRMCVSVCGTPLWGSFSWWRDSDHRFPVKPLSRVAGTGSQTFCDAPGSTCKLLECDFDNANVNICKASPGWWSVVWGNLLVILMKIPYFITVVTPEVKSILRSL